MQNIASFIKWQVHTGQLTRKYERKALKSSGAAVLAELQTDREFLCNFGSGGSQPLRELKKKLKAIDQMKADNKFRAAVRVQRVDSLDMGPGRADKIRNRRNVLRQIHIMLAEQNVHTGITSTLDISDGVGITQQSVSRTLPDLEELGYIRVDRDGKKALRITSLIPVTSREVKEFKRAQDLAAVLEEQRAKLPEPNQAIIESNLIARERWAEGKRAWLGRRTELAALNKTHEVVITEEGRADLGMGSLDELIEALGTETAFELADIAQDVIAEQPAKELVSVGSAPRRVSFADYPGDRARAVAERRAAEVQANLRARAERERALWEASKALPEPPERSKTAEEPQRVPWPEPRHFRHLGDGAYDAYKAACKLWQDQNPDKSLITGKLKTVEAR